MKAEENIMFGWKLNVKIYEWDIISHKIFK